jgi:cytochrome c nitrite reductase small subunit
LTRRKWINLGRVGIVLAVLFGLLVGVGSFTFLYGEGLSYFSTDPRACMNCHIMRPQYDSWQKSSHHTAAKCVDCHLPHDFVGKYIAKGDNGYRHSWAFTFQDFHEPIQITPRNARILQNNCVACHKDFVHSVLGSVTAGTSAGAETTSCVHCHADVGHGPRTGLGR